MVKLENISFSYDKNIIIDNINKEISDNLIYGINGKSGCGKTTMFELIDGLIKPSEGTIYINDEKMSKNIRKEIGFVFQMAEEQFFESTVKKEIEFATKNFKIKDNKIVDVLNLVGLNETYLNRNLKDLSNGEKRMVAIASVLIYNPKIILFDESTIGLDKNNKKNLINIIKKLKNYNKTILIVSHDVDLLYQITDKMIIMDKGKIILSGDTSTIYNDLNILIKNNISIPKIVLFEKLVKDKKKIRLVHSNCVNDLIKEVYRNV